MAEARFKLKPCHLREDNIIPDKDAEVIELNWRELVLKLAPSNSIASLRTLGHIQKNAYVGLLESSNNGPYSNFCFVAQDRSGNITSVVKRSPCFSGRLKSVYQIVSVDKGVVMTEPGVLKSRKVA